MCDCKPVLYPQTIAATKTITWSNFWRVLTFRCPHTYGKPTTARFITEGGLHIRGYPCFLCRKVDWRVED